MENSNNWYAAAKASDNSSDLLEHFDKQLKSSPTQDSIVFLFTTLAAPVGSILSLIQKRRANWRVYGASGDGVLGKNTIALSGYTMLVIPADQMDIVSLAFQEPDSEFEWMKLVDRIKMTEQEFVGDHSVAILVSNGNAQREEHVTARLHLALSDLPLVGGSTCLSSPDQQTYVIQQNEIHPDHNLLLLVRSKLHVRIFHHHHFHPTDRDVVVTGLGYRGREVLSLNGKSAPREMAHILDIDQEKFGIEQVSGNPLGLKVHDRWYIRSIASVEQNSLIFACGVEVGTVLTVMASGDILQSLNTLFGSFNRCQGMILFNCLGRYFELEQKQLIKPFRDKVSSFPVAGMNSRGEQFMGMHLNHTLTGLAFCND